MYTVSLSHQTGSIAVSQDVSHDDDDDDDDDDYDDDDYDDDDFDDADSDDDDDCGKCQGVAAQSCFYKNSTLCIRNEWVAYDDDDDDDDERNDD